MRRSTYMLILAAAVVAVACACILLMEADDSDAGTITFDAGDGTVTRSDGTNNTYKVTVSNGTSITLPGANPNDNTYSYTYNRDGYGLVGWETGGWFGNEYKVGDSYRVSGNATLTAIWGRVTLDPNGGTITRNGSTAVNTLNYPAGIEAPGDTMVVSGSTYVFSNNGYGLLGWNTRNNRNSGVPAYIPGDGQSLPEDTTLYAIWGQATFNANGGTINLNGSAYGQNSLTIPIDYSSTAPGDTIDNSGMYTYVRNGYGFLGWSTDQNATTPTYTYGDKLLVRNGQTYYAVWSDRIITIDVNGGTMTYSNGSSAGQRVVLDIEKLTKAPSTMLNIDGTKYILSKTGYGLLGWSTNSSATTPEYAIGANLPASPSSSYTLYAIWAQGVTFDANGGTVTDPDGVTVPAFTAPLSSPYAAPEYQFTIGSATYVYAKSDSTYTYVLRGWATNSSAETPDYRPGDSIPTSLSGSTLYAVWTSGIIFDPNGGIVTDANGNPKSPYVMTSYEPLYVPGYAFTLDESRYIYSKQGASFLGWSTDPDALQGEYTEGNILAPSDTGYRLYAIWTRDSYPLTLVYSDTYSVTVNVPYKFNMDLISYMKYNTGMEDYRIVGWNTVPMNLSDSNKDANGAYRIQTTGTRYSQYVLMDSVTGLTLYPIWAKAYTTGNGSPVNINNGTGCYYITGTSTNGGEITISGGTPYVFVDNANVTSASKSAFSLTNNTRIELTVIGESTFTGATNQRVANNRYAGYAGISVATGTTLTVSEYSAGRLSAYGGDAVSTNNAYGFAGAGIGSNGSNTTVQCGTVVINGGTVLAVGGALIRNLANNTSSTFRNSEYSGAGIGGTGSVVTINGGVVTAAAGAMYGKYMNQPTNTNTYVTSGGIEGDPINSNNLTISPNATVYQYDSTGGTTNIPDPIKIRFSPIDTEGDPCTIGNAYGLTVNGYSIDLAGMTIKTNTEVEIPRYMVEDGDGNLITPVSIILTTGHNNYFTGDGIWNDVNKRYNATINERTNEPHGSINIYANEQKITGNETWGTITPSTDTTVAGTGSYVSYDFVISLNEGYEFGGLEKKSGDVWQEYNIGTGEAIVYGDMMVTVTLRIPISNAGSTTDISFTVTQIKKTVSIELPYSEGAHNYDVAMVATDNTDAGTIVWASGNVSATHKVYYKSTVTYTLTNHDNTDHYYVQLITVNGVTITPEISSDGTQYSFTLRDVCDDTAIVISLRPTFRINMAISPQGGAVCTTAYVSIVDENGNPVKGLEIPSDNNSYFYANANSTVYFKINEYTEDTTTGDILGISSIRVAMYDGNHLVTYTIPAGLLDTYTLDVVTGDTTITVEITASNKTVTYSSLGSTYIFEVKEGSYISLPTEEELFDQYGLNRKVGYDLLRWSIGDITLNPGSQYHVTNDVTFYAVWDDTPHEYRITFVLDGGQAQYKKGDDPYETATTGTIVFYNITTEGVRIEAATRTGYSFAGWEGHPGSEAIVIPEGTIGDIELSVVRWDPTTITITYDKNNPDSTIVFPQPSFTRLFGTEYGDLPIYSNFETETASYSFAGWATDSAGIHRVSPNTKVSDPNNHTIYIIWILNSNDSRIINVVNDGSYGGTVGVSARSVSPGSTVTVTMEPYTGYEVSSISVNGEVTQLSPGTTQHVVSIPDDSGSEDPVRLYYIEVTFVPTKYYIQITQYSDVYPDGHTDYYDTGVYDAEDHPYFTIESQPIYITRSTVGTYAQHAFLGWTGTGISGTEPNYIPLLTGSTGDREYTEVWEASRYSITYNLQDDIEHPASHTNPSTYRTGTALVLENPKRLGYIALGWFTAAVGGDKVEVIPDTSAADIVLYAQWTEARAVAEPDITNFLYDGTAHSGVTPHQAGDDEGYVLTGDVTKTYAGTYTVTVTLNDGFYWAGKSEEHRFDTLTLTWNITKRDLYISSESLWKIYDGSALTPSEQHNYEALGMASADSTRITITTNGNSYTNAGRYINTITFTDNIAGHLALLSYNIHVYNGVYVIVEETSTTLTINIETPGPSLGRTMTVITGHVLDSQPGNVQAIFLRRLS